MEVVHQMRSRHCDELDLGYMLVLAVAAVAVLVESAWVRVAGLVQAVVAAASAYMASSAAGLVQPVVVAVAPPMVSPAAVLA